MNRVNAQRIVAHAYDLAEGSSGTSQDQALESLAYFLDLIDLRYYRSVDTGKLAQAALRNLDENAQNLGGEHDVRDFLKDARNAMVAELDRHSQFYDHDEFEDFKQQLKGNFSGIGVRILKHESGVLADPIRDSPAARAGMRKGDVIFRVGAVSLAGFKMSEIVGILRGKVGTNVTLSVLRGLDTIDEETLNFSITRAVVHQILVVARVEDEVGYIRVRGFSEDTDDLVEEALRKFERQSLYGYVIDVRGNPGGFLQQAVTLTDYFLDRGVVVSVRGRKRDETFSASSHASITQRPVVVLIDQGTASSSEIFAIALADHQRARLIGEQTYGKGTVQTLLGLHNGEGLKLTTARYFSPQGTSLIDEGITPDIELVDDLTTTQDEPLFAAIAELKSLSRLISNSGVKKFF
ncbi:MAG: S41 family peptidase [Alphaproteobacteria bacterium]|nr:S41 family peptidase [Alphaproteobacteria bacterium]